MESQNRRLKDYLSGIIENLGANDPNNNRSETGEPAVPHSELIDFDQLQVMLRETITELDAACANGRDIDVVRKWFISRIVSLRRGRQAILSENRSDKNCEALEEASLPHLLRNYEDESARLRSTAINFKSITGCNNNRKADDYRQFKSG